MAIERGLFFLIIVYLARNLVLEIGVEWVDWGKGGGGGWLVSAIVLRDIHPEFHARTHVFFYHYTACFVKYSLFKKNLFPCSVLIGMCNKIYFTNIWYIAHFLYIVFHAIVNFSEIIIPHTGFSYTFKYFCIFVFFKYQNLLCRINFFKNTGNQGK